MVSAFFLMADGMGMCRCQLMQAACIEGFSMNDLMNPTPQRVIRVLSALHNYYAFRKMRLSEFQKIKDNCEILLDQKAEQENKNAELAERIDEAKYALGRV